VKDSSIAALRERRPFREGNLTGEPCEPWRDTQDGKRWVHGSVVRIFAGALREAGTAGAVGTGELPYIGDLDVAPAMALALFEARYVVRSYDTPIAWWLGPEVYGSGPEGKWIEVAEKCNDDYGRFSGTTTRHQNAVHAALTSHLGEERHGTERQRDRRKAARAGSR
jgi:hypothetical protein